MFLMFRWADTLMLGRYGSAAEVGVYSVSVTLAAFLTLPLVALDVVYMPIAGELYAKNRSSDLAKTYQVLTKWIFSVTLPVFFILFFFPEITITFLFGERFTDSALPLRILSVGFLFNAFLGTNSMLLLVMGRSQAVMKVAACGTMLNIVLNYILIKKIGLGMEGAAFASMGSFLAIGLGYSFVLYRSSGIHPFATGYLKPVVGSALIGVVIYGAAKSLPLLSWMLPVYFLLFIFGYVVSLILTRSLDAEDVFLFGEILKRAGIDPELTQKMIRLIYKHEKDY
jgi:O-antigen/teichoic acid export membrane protein